MLAGSRTRKICEYILLRIIPFHLYLVLSAIIGPLFVWDFAPVRHRRALRGIVFELRNEPFSGFLTDDFYHRIDENVVWCMNEVAFGGIVICSDFWEFAVKGICVRKWSKIGPFSPGFRCFIKGTVWIIVAIFPWVVRRFFDVKKGKKRFLGKRPRAARHTHSSSAMFCEIGLFLTRNDKRLRKEKGLISPTFHVKEERWLASTYKV